MSETDSTKKESTLPLKWSGEAVKQISQVEVQKSRVDGERAKDCGDEKLNQQSWCGISYSLDNVSRSRY